MLGQGEQEGELDLLPSTKCWDALNPSSLGPTDEREFYVWGKTDTFLNLFGSSDGVNLKILYRYFITKNMYFFFVILS